jgi:hypothetical protein
MGEAVHEYLRHEYTNEVGGARLSTNTSGTNTRMRLGE